MFRFALPPLIVVERMIVVVIDPRIMSRQIVVHIVDDALDSLMKPRNDLVPSLATNRRLGLRLLLLLLEMLAFLTLLSRLPDRRRLVIHESHSRAWSAAVVATYIGHRKPLC